MQALQQEQTMQVSWQDSLVFRADFALAAGAYERNEPTCFQGVALVRENYISFLNRDFAEDSGSGQRWWSVLRFRCRSCRSFWGSPWSLGVPQVLHSSWVVGTSGGWYSN